MIHTVKSSSGTCMAFVVPSNIADKKWKDNQNVVAYIIELVTVGMAGWGILKFHI